VKSVRERLNIFMEALPIEAKKSLGQNFLVSDHVVEKILDAARNLKPASMIEIGPGPGALTDQLRNWGLPFQVIELDRGLAEHWRNSGVTVTEVDALQADWKKIFESISEEPLILVSNLPYQISSSLVIDRCLDEKGFEAMVLMFQKEVAQRIRAQAATSAYGLLSVVAQNFWEIKTVCEASPRDFSPAPKVASRVLSFVRKNSEIKNRKKFLRFVKAAFAQRRKQLKGNLLSDPDWQEKSPKLLPEWLEAQKKPLTVRAEELSPSELKALYFYFQLE